MRDARPLAAAVVFSVYLGAAFAVGNRYPLSTFEMYAAARTTAVSRVVARDVGGEAREVDAYEAWRCDGAIVLDQSACLASWPYAYTVYLDDAAAGWIARHPGDGDEPVSVVRRVWRVTSAAGAPPHDDCVLQRCRARRKGP